MKKMKKLLSMLLAVIMVLAMAAPSFADETPTGTITINKAIKDQTYHAYKIFDLESHSGSNYSYKVVNEWKTFLDNYSTYFTIDGNGYLTSNSPMDAETTKSFAKDALEFANKTGKYAERDGAVIAYSYNATLTESKEGEGNNEKTVYTATFSPVALGYYLIDSSAGTVCALDTTDDTINIEEKNVAPGATKTTPVTTVTIGQTVPYTIRIEAKPGAQNYIAYDKMSEGLTFDASSLSVMRGGTLDENGTLTGSTAVDNTDNANYTLVQNDLTDDRTFEVRFTRGFCDTITTATDIYIQYNATVNEKAIIVNAITNEAGLTYGHNNGASTVPSTVTVNTYSFDLRKVRNVNGSYETLQNATFKLYRRTGDSEDNYTYTRINVVPVTKDGEVVANHYRADGELTGEQDNDTDGLITAGAVNIDGLGNGTYVLEEVSAPTGYNKLVGYTNPVEINGADNTTTLEVVNNTGTVLPATGGIGTTIFYAVGIILMAGAVFFVVRKKRA